MTKRNGRDRRVFGGWLRAALLGGTLAIVALPGVALAHAHLRKSEPSANARMTSSPHVLRLWYTEAPELSQTVVTLLDASGATVAVGHPEPDADGELNVRVPILPELASGRYTVRWRTAAADGHPSSGSFAFVVATTASAVTPPVAPSGGAGVSVVTDSASRRVVASPSTSDADALTPAWIVARAASFLALLAVIGAVAFRGLVLPRAYAIDVADRDELARTVANRALALGIVFLVAAAAKLYLQNRMMSGSAAADIAHMETMSMETHWGFAWRLQFGAGALAILAFALARRRIAGGWALAALAAVGMAASAALGGHAAAAERWRAFSLVDDAVHVVAASGWLGSLLWLLVAGLGARSASEGRAGRVAALVRAFSPVALGCAGLVVLTGLASAWMRLGSVSALWLTSYGQVLIVKLLLLAGVAGTGFFNWQSVQPSLGSDVGTARLRRSATVELAIGVAVILATAVLVAMPTPMDLR